MPKHTSRESTPRTLSIRETGTVDKVWIKLPHEDVPLKPAQSLHNFVETEKAKQTEETEEHVPNKKAR